MQITQLWFLCLYWIRWLEKQSQLFNLVSYRTFFTGNNLHCEMCTAKSRNFSPVFTITLFQFVSVSEMSWLNSPLQTRTLTLTLKTRFFWTLDHYPLASLRQPLLSFRSWTAFLFSSFSNYKAQHPQVAKLTLSWMVPPPCFTVWIKFFVLQWHFSSSFAPDLCFTKLSKLAHI